MFACLFVDTIYTCTRSTDGRGGGARACSGRKLSAIGIRKRAGARARCIESNNELSTDNTKGDFSIPFSRASRCSNNLFKNAPVPESCASDGPRLRSAETESLAAPGNPIMNCQRADNAKDHFTIFSLFPRVVFSIRE